MQFLRAVNTRSDVSQLQDFGSDDDSGALDNKYDTSPPKRQRTTPMPARRCPGAAFVPCGYLVFLFTDAVATVARYAASRSK